jgi:PST family polysaccharide transporter
MYTSANIVVLGLFTSTTMVGYYSIAEKLYYALQGVYHPIIHTIYPYFAKNNDIQMYKKLFFSIVTFNFVAFLILFNFSEELIYLLFNLTNSEIITIFNIFLLSSILHVPAIFLGYPFLAAFGFSKYANITVIYSSIFHIIGLSILALFCSITIYNVAIMVILTESVVFFTRLFYIKKVNLI